MAKTKDEMLAQLHFKNLEINGYIVQHTCIGCGLIDKANTNQLCWNCWWDCEGVNE